LKSENIPLEYKEFDFAATLDSITNQCCEDDTDGEETQKQIHFTVLFTAL